MSVMHFHLCNFWCHCTNKYVEQLLYKDIVCQITIWDKMLHQIQYLLSPQTWNSLARHYSHLHVCNAHLHCILQYEPNLVWSTLTWLTTMEMRTLGERGGLLTSCNVFSCLLVNWTSFSTQGCQCVWKVKCWRGYLAVVIFSPVIYQETGKILEENQISNYDVNTDNI